MGTLKRDTVRITQNIDGLLHEAGCEGVLELHGNLRLWRC
jgi:NAD-dependent deacetylase